MLISSFILKISKDLFERANINEFVYTIVSRIKSLIQNYPTLTKVKDSSNVEPLCEYFHAANVCHLNYNLLFQSVIP